MKVLLTELGLYSRTKASKLFMSGLGPLRRLYFGLGKNEMPEKTHPGGPCLPGVMRPFVDADGNIYPCERVSEGSAATRIGHIDTGFDIKQVEAVMNVGQLTKDECLKCWNFDFCTLCVAACDEGEHLCGKERLKYCNGAMSETLHKFRTLCLMLENGYDFEMPNYAIRKRGEHHD